METIRLPSVDSTMDEAKRRARAGAPHGTIVVADQQTAGRGQHGRTWASPEGGLYLSIVLRDLTDARFVTLAVGCAVAETLEVAGVDAQLKWVNDVWVGGKKVAGILVEGESTGSQVDFLVAGIGINVNDAVGAALPQEATSVMAELGCESCIPDLEAVLVKLIHTWLARCTPESRGEVLAAFRARDALKGKTVTVENGPKGTADGIDDEGHLLVKTASGVVPVLAGTVRVA